MACLMSVSALFFLSAVRFHKITPAARIASARLNPLPHSGLLSGRFASSVEYVAHSNEKVTKKSD